MTDIEAKMLAALNLTAADLEPGDDPLTLAETAYVNSELALALIEMEV